MKNLKYHYAGETTISHSKPTHIVRHVHVIDLQI